jgi:hypothetical protein
LPVAAYLSLVSDGLIVEVTGYKLHDAGRVGLPVTRCRLPLSDGFILGVTGTGRLPVAGE